MGNFEGHALPGSFFIIFGLWATLCQFVRFHQSHYLKKTAPYRNSNTFKPFCLCGKLKTLELEGILKIFFCSVGFFLEMYTGSGKGKLVMLGNGQHATMFFFFGMSGLVDLMLHYNMPLPKSLGYLMMVLALLVEGTLFNFHLHGRNDLDVTIHTLLLYLIFLAIIAIFTEIKLPESVLAGLARSFFIIVQGTWFWQIGFILYNPLPGAHPWDGNDHEQILIATMIFAWHLGAVFILQMIIGGAVAAVYNVKGGLPGLGGNSNINKLIKTHLLANGDCIELGYEQVNIDESDCEV